jgi:hypothetical protein
LTNAREELLHFLENKPDVVCLTFSRLQADWDEGPYTTGTLEEILPLMHFDYDSGFGSQELYGTIWFADGSWATRGEYDGSEWWQHHTPPVLPQGFQ